MDHRMRLDSFHGVHVADN